MLEAGVVVVVVVVVMCVVVVFLCYCACDCNTAVKLNILKCEFMRIHVNHYKPVVKLNNI